MKQRPILFSSEMVRAIMAGKKTQTRRIVKGMALDWLRPDMFTPEFVSDPENNLCPYGKISDQLWVRETFVWEGDTKYTDMSPIGDFWYKADFPDGDGPTKWKPSIFMPREACRITLEITDIQVETLNYISKEDAKAEGITWEPGQQWKVYHNLGFTDAYRSQFYELWEKINGPRSWTDNPWVWVVTFKRIEQ